jgi:non-ribosomal peptide synthetase component F
MKAQEVYWLDLFPGELPESNLPTDYPRPNVRSFEGSTLGFQSSEEETKALREMALEGSMTLFMVLLALYIVFLAKISGKEDIVIGLPIANRRHADLESVIGMFANTLAFRSYPSKEKTFREFLDEVKERILEAFENQDYQLEDLVAKVVLDRDVSRNPLFDVMFDVKTLEASNNDLPEAYSTDLKFKPYSYKNNTTIIDLVLVCTEKKENLFFEFIYCTELFKQETIERFSNYLKDITRSVLENNKNIKLKDIEISSNLVASKSFLLEEEQEDFDF